MLSCKPAEAFLFLSDLRNLERFIPEGSVTSLKIDEEECSFHVDMTGDVTIRISGKHPYTEIIYSGTVPQTSEFSLTVDLAELPAGNASARLCIKAGINPFIRMLIEGPVRKVLETIISEMENFRGWNEAV